jgi:hypothetical protein
MRTLFVCALAATVVGCSCYAPPQASIDACLASGLACLDRSSLSQTIEPEQAAFDAGLSAPKARSKIAARTEKPPSAHARHKTDLAVTTTKSATPTAAAKVEPAANKVEPAAAKVEPPASGRPAETSDQVIARAKTAIAAKWMTRGQPSSARSSGPCEQIPWENPSTPFAATSKAKKRQAKALEIGRFFIS